MAELKSIAIMAVIFGLRECIKYEKINSPEHLREVIDEILSLSHTDILDGVIGYLKTIEGQENEKLS